jgi:hypothetical protein
MHPKLFAAGAALLVACGTPTVVDDVRQAAAEQDQQHPLCQTEVRHPE